MLAVFESCESVTEESVRDSVSNQISEAVSEFVSDGSSVSILFGESTCQ